jgi:hypothetical protein
MALLKPSGPEPKKSAEIIGALVLGPNAPFCFRKNALVTTGITSFLPWEQDLIVVNPSQYLLEIEVKVSMSDWRIDAAKQKFETRYLNDWQRVREFWYAAPLSLAQRWEHVKLGRQEVAGIIGVHGPRHGGRFGLCEVIRPAIRVKEVQKVTDTELGALRRLGAMRQWELLVKLGEARGDAGPDNDNGGGI